MGALRDAVIRLTAAVDGIDWSASDVKQNVEAILQHSASASPTDLEDALETMIVRLARARVEDADGVAHVALTSGTLVERGASPGALAQVLTQTLPSVLAAARRYADRCIAALGPPPPEDDDEPEFDAIAEVDGRRIPRVIFNRFLVQDRPGAAALVNLERWVLPAVAALTRDRAALTHAKGNPELCAAARGLCESQAHWLDVLLGVELDARWRVLCPPQQRGFHATVDGIVMNFDLYALLSDALIARGIDGPRNPRDVIAFVEGRARGCQQQFVVGSHAFYTHRAAGIELDRKGRAPLQDWVWGEGRPADVPEFEGLRTVLVGPLTVESKTWNVGRIFSALPAKVTVTDEIPPAEVSALLERMK